MPDIMPISLQNILHGRQSEMRTLTYRVFRVTVI